MIQKGGCYRWACLSLLFTFASLSMAAESTLPACNAGERKHNCFGSEVFSDGDRYIGEWKDGLMTGQGRYVFRKGQQWVGRWDRGSPVLRQGRWIEPDETEQRFRSQGYKVGFVQAQSKCLDLGIKESTEAFGECVLKLSK